jgi:hypothetical protein
MRQCVVDMRNLSIFALRTQGLLTQFLLIVVLCIVSFATNAGMVETCAQIDDSSQMASMRKSLDARGIKYKVDGNLICAPSRYRSEFIAAMLKVFPAREGVPALRVPPSPRGIPLTSTKMIAPEHQQALETELKRRDIWFTKDKTGAVWYEVTREREVQEIVFRIATTVAVPRQRDLAKSRNIEFPKKAYADILASLLDERGIKYSRKYEDGWYLLTWDAKDTDQVEPLIGEAYRRITAREKQGSKDE